jgi:hypothetical protein
MTSFWISMTLLTLMSFVQFIATMAHRYGRELLEWLLRSHHH